MGKGLAMTDKEWIDGASYEQLLRRWRFAKAGEDHIFQGESGEYYAATMFDKIRANPAAAVAVSKRVGWEAHS